MNIAAVGIVGLGIIGAGLAVAWYRVVPPTQAHFVVSRQASFIASAEKKLRATGVKGAYFDIPAAIPFIGRKVRKMDLTIKELILEQETYEKDQARYMVRSSTKYRISDVEKAANSFSTELELAKQLEEVINASVRAVTVKYNVIDARANKALMSTEIQTEITDDLAKWGLELVNFQLVDFRDTTDSTIISDISKRREVEIKSETRQLNAQKIREARIKEAEADEKSQEREIARDQFVGKQKQDMAKEIADHEKTAREATLEVQKVQQVKTQEIEKERALVEAAQRKAVEAINKEQKKLEGEGDRARLEELAIGEAAKTKQEGLAQAAAKEALQVALNKFGDAAIRALVAEQVVQMQKEVGVAGAKALEKADLKIFAGGDDNSKAAFDIGKALAGLTVSNETAAASVMNRLAKPNDLGFIGLAALQKLAEDSNKQPQK